MTPRTRAVRWVAIPMLSLTIACGGTCRRPSPSPSEQPTPAQLTEAVRAAAGFEREIPRETFDPKAVAAGLGSDPQRIFEWVRDKTYWVPYRGALRGAVGVLMDRLGNSLDRSLLLAELLRESGQTVRLVHARLDSVLAAELAKTLGSPPRQALPKSEAGFQPDRVSAFGLDVAKFRADEAKASARLAADMDELSKRVGAQTSLVATVIGQPRATADDAALRHGAAADHWWVQRQMADRWTDLDPSFATLDPSRRPPPVQIFGLDDSQGRIPVPREFAHEVTIRIVIEQWNAGRLREHTALEHRFRPAETLGQQIVIDHIPVTSPPIEELVGAADPVAAVKAVAQDQKAWLPILRIGSRVIAQSSFEKTGELNRRPALNPGIAPPPTGGIASAFAGEEEAAPVEKHLTAEWIEYGIHVPGQASRTIRRRVFDVVPPDARTEQKISEDVIVGATRVDQVVGALARIDVLLQFCQLSQPFVRSERLRALTKNGDALIAAAERTAASDRAGALQHLNRIDLVHDDLYRLALARFEWSWTGAETYITEPNILTYRTEVIEDTTGTAVARLGFDIVSNRVAVKASSPFKAFHTRLAQGIVDTNVESLLPDRPSIGNTGAIMATMSTGDEWVLVRGKTDRAGLAEAWPLEGRDLVDRWLQRGLWVVAPRTMPPGGHFAFWIIDPVSGSALGIGHQGWGQDSNEMTVLEWAGAIAGGTLLGIMVGLNNAFKIWMVAAEVAAGKLTPPPPPPPPPPLPNYSCCGS